MRRLSGLILFVCILGCVGCQSNCKEPNAIKVTDGDLVCIQGPDGYAAVRVDKQSLSPEFCVINWWVVGADGLVTEADASGNSECTGAIRFEGYAIGWSAGRTGTGHLYLDSGCPDMHTPKPAGMKYAILAGVEDIGEIDFRELEYSLPEGREPK